MLWFIITHLLSTFLNCVSICRLSPDEKDLEILLLRQQLDIYERKLSRPPRIARIEKLTLAVLTNKLKRTTQRTYDQLRLVVRIFQPETILKWHRELVRRKWTFHHQPRGGRPHTCTEIELLVVRMANENLRWGYSKIKGELLKLGYQVGRTTISDILSRYGITPAPQRSKSSSSWKRLMKHYKDQLLACDFFTVETLWLKTLYVLFFIEHGTRRVHFAGCTTNPNASWVLQQARQMVWVLEDSESTIQLAIHDRDTKFTASFDTVFQSERIKVIQTPFRSPNANAIAERWVRTVREECLDHLLIFNRKHLRKVLKEFVNYYNFSRPHQGIGQQMPFPRAPAENAGAVCCRDVLGGIIHDYYRVPVFSPHGSG